MLIYNKYSDGIKLKLQLFQYFYKHLSAHKETKTFKSYFYLTKKLMSNLWCHQNCMPYMIGHNTPQQITCRHCRCLKGIHFRSDTNRTGAKGLSFYYPRLLHCLNQMLAVVLLSQHRVSSSKTIRPHAPCGTRCIGHTVRTWSAVCSEVPHLQFSKRARPHLCMKEWNCPTPVHRQLSLTQAAQGKPIPTGLAPVPGTKARSLEAFSQYSIFHL